MFKVDAKVDYYNEQSTWERGMIRMSEDESLIIMVIEGMNIGDLNAVVLKNDKNSADVGILDDSYSDYWIKKCPVIVEDASLTLGGTVKW